MRLQDRDLKVLSEIALHGVMTRDQIIALGYFKSVTRANARLGSLVRRRLLIRVNPIDGISSRQSLYAVPQRASTYLDERIARLLVGRKQTPRFIAHSLMVVDVRIQLERLGAKDWHHEPCVWHKYSIGANHHECRPDGLAMIAGHHLFIEADRGNASTKSLRETFSSYDRYAKSGMFQNAYKSQGFRVLVITTGKRRAITIGNQGKRHVVAISVITLAELASATSLKEVLL